MAQRSILDIIVRQKAEGKGIKDAEKNVGGLEGKLNKLATAGALAGLALAGAFAKISIDSIKLAGDVEEMESKFNAVFKETAPEAKRELEAFGDEVNRSSVELQEMASSVQDTFVPLGFARDEAKDLSIELTKLAVDVASFNNKLEVDVMRDFQSALVGNTETVRKYGIVITQDAISQELLNMGILGGAKAATAEQKALASLNLILAGTTDAHGDAAKTADSFVNSLKGIDANIKDLKIAWGNALMPTIKKGLPILQQATDGFVAMVDSQTAVDEAVAAGALTMEEAIDVWGSYATEQERAAALTDITSQHLEAQGILFEEANKVVDGWATGMILAAEASGELTEGLEEVAEAGDEIPALEAKFAANRAEIDLNTAASNALWDSMNVGIRSSIDTLQEQIAFLLAGGAGVQAAFENVQSALRAGLIAPEEAEMALREIELAAIAIQVETEKISMEDAAASVEDEFNVSMKEAVRLIELAGQFIDSIPARIEKRIEFFIEYTGAPLPGPGGQTGLDMVVPQGFPNDTFPLKASSGERVTITPAGETTENFNLTISSQATQEDIEANFDLMKAMKQGAS